MAKYVDKAVVIEKLEYYIDNFGHGDRINRQCSRLSVEDAISAVEDAPAADVRPERHGHWSDKMVAVSQKNKVGYHEDDYAFGFQCSECGEVLNKTAYCGNCGAKMDGGRQK